MKNYWISWYGPKAYAFTLYSPWWISGTAWSKDDDEIDIFCAAVKANSEEDAKEVIRKSHDKYEELDFRFCSERPDDWSPFCERFERADWMKF
jgi:hypothetical protein